MRKKAVKKTQNLNDEQNAKDIPPAVTVIEDDIKRTIKLTNDDLRDKIFKAVNDRYYAVDNDIQNDIQNYDRWERQYVGTEAPSTDSQAQLQSRQAWNAVEDWTSILMYGFNNVVPPIEIEAAPNKRTVEQQTLYKITQVLYNKNFLETNSTTELEKTYREGVKLGTFTTKVAYTVDTVPVLQKTEKPSAMQEVLGIGEPDISLETVDKQEGRVPLKHVDIRRLHFRKDKPSWVIEDIISDWGSIEAMADKYGTYTNLERAKETKLSQDDITSGDDNEEDLATVADVDGDVFLWEAHRIPIYFKKSDPVPDSYKGKTVECLVTIANESEVIRCQAEPNRETPYQIEPFFMQKGVVTGRGVLEVIEPLIDEYTTRRNQALDANTFGLYCMIVANERYIKDKKDLRIRQNGVIRIKNVDRPISEILQFLRPPSDYATSSLKWLDVINEEIQKTIRLKGAMAGEKIAPNPSATEAQSIISEAQKSVEAFITRIDRDIPANYFERSYVQLILNRSTPWLIEAEPKVEEMPYPGMTEIPLTPIEREMGGPSVQMATPGIPIKPQNKSYEDVHPEDILTEGIRIAITGTKYLMQGIAERNQLMQILDVAAKYASQPIPNDKGQLVTFSMYTGLNDLFGTFNKVDANKLWTPVPPPPPPEPQPGGDGQIPLTGIEKSMGINGGQNAPSGPTAFNSPSDASNVLKSNPLTPSKR